MTDSTSDSPDVLTPLRQFYETDFSYLLNSSKTAEFTQGGNRVQIRFRSHYDFNANALFLSFYIPETPFLLEVCKSIIAHTQDNLDSDRTFKVRHNAPGEPEMKSEDLVFTGRVFLYCEGPLTDSEIEIISATARQRDLVSQVRGPTYASERLKHKHPLAFISHDSRDKELVARPLAEKLSAMMCPVWYDEFSLRLGDSLRESIEKGLKECKKCVLILSKSFFANEGWTKAELDVIFTREIAEKKKLFLPVWFDVSGGDVYQYSATLKNRHAVKWSNGLDEVAKQIRSAVESSD